MNNNRSLLHIELCKKPELYELHTHLLGMGNSEFRINTVLTNKAILPTNAQFHDDLDLRQRLGPLIWCRNRFANKQRTAKFFDCIRDGGNNNSDDDDQNVKETLKNLDTSELRDEMKHRELSFAESFSYDVIVSLKQSQQSIFVV